MEAGEDGVPGLSGYRRFVGRAVPHLGGYDKLRMEAQKVPKKVKRLSMCLLICFMLIYVVVILEQIVTSMGILFL